jgi:hypothetical protein
MTASAISLIRDRLEYLFIITQMVTIAALQLYLSIGTSELIGEVTFMIKSNKSGINQFIRF